jgi:hypothetical protein
MARQRLRLEQTARALIFAGIGLAAVPAARFAAAGRPPSALPLHVTLEPIAGLAVAARLVVTAPGATSIVVRHGADAAHLGDPLKLPLSDAGGLTTAVVGLAPDAISSVEVVAEYPEQLSRSSGVLTVRTPSMPPGVPASFPVTEGEGGASGFVLLSLVGQDNPTDVAVVVDRAGRVVWYRPTGGGAFSFERAGRARLLLHQYQSFAFEEVSLDGSVVRTWTDPNSVNGADGHDFARLPDGDVLLFGAEMHHVDSRSFFAGGVDGATRWDDTLSEIAPSGEVLYRWSTWEHCSEDELTPDPVHPTNPRDYEVAHLNSVDALLDGSFVLSFRESSTVARVDRKSGRFTWRLGGKHGEFRFVGDRRGGFSRQHDARLLGPGRVLLFDNGTLGDPPESRAAEYQLDFTTKTAALVWEHRQSPPVVTRIWGSAQRLSGGNTLIGWGTEGVVSEVDAASRTVWELRTPGQGVYRARAVSALY